MSPFLSDCLSLMLGIAIHCIQHSQAMLERGVCELAHPFFHFTFVFLLLVKIGSLYHARGMIMHQTLFLRHCRFFPVNTRM